ncbi:VapA/VapB family virulence-associated protein [Xenorhabdus sp. KK7.4]|uniref:VapA/VapB family virulence-associated protein n=1 Tax=Xenorhabdus sp. KK7.4 TaxID=1851572 RepID=UPI000C05EBE5|nr:VapA/VapB family virulence-associated protein [Xenorhabdus sp. KK7.4]PHM53411.1 hypothetical protein Xekk_02913 [Xenorhabdus sp. KK7.4]
MKKTLSTESRYSIISESVPKVIDSLTESTKNILSSKMAGDTFIDESKIKDNLYKAHLTIKGYLYYEITLEIYGGKTFYGKGGGFGSPGIGDYDGGLDVYSGDISNLYENGKIFSALITPVSAAVGLLDTSLNALAMLDSLGIGTISTSIMGGGYWE